MHAKWPVMGPRHPDDLDLLGDLSLVMHCPLLAGPFAMWFLQTGASLQSRDDTAQSDKEAGAARKSIVAEVAFAFGSEG